MLKKALEQPCPGKSIDKISGIPTIKEIAKKLANEIYNNRFEPYWSWEFEFPKPPYSFYCDVTVRHTEFELTCPNMYKDGIETDCPAGILYELTFEIKKILD